ncbi:putative ribonucleoside reductase alpha chain [Nitrincola phage 1M3-16]|uniref:putative ribonucleoside reductase alpha chain n=1 Tax=Nitrincola phage 1M3-16 TaxID=1472912 RepID=UPI000444E885|nr:putative ribonucleoside reductase alpha chain [Nitrincola phage 1M3-16]AHX01144.1 putative ribonucleoside reductase alpha chain [Nitrincola phage 1M3-16]
MINKVTKRDGTVEDFDVDNINRWSDWASSECGVDWSSIVFDAVRSLPEECTTSELHQALINACLSKRTEGHTKMAARLLVGQIYKEAYGCFSIPSLKDFYEEAVEEGRWVDMGYTDYELEQLDSVIDHTKDFTYTYATLKQMYDKYMLNFSGHPVESPQMTFMGIAMNQMRNEDDKLSKVISAYQGLSNLNLNLPTPTLNGSRTSLESSPSCVVISGGDTVDSINAAINVAYTMTAQRAGIGIELTTRGPNDPVKGGLVRHGGKHSYYSHIDSAVKANSQVTRGGSATVSYCVLDPEIEGLLTMKQQRTPENYRIDTLDYSFKVNTSFLRRMAKNEDWMLVSVYYAPTLWDLFYSGDVGAFEAEYQSVLSSFIPKKIVKARDVMQAWISSRADTGRNYITFIDNMNQHTPFNEPIRLSNLCVAGGTLILTDEGSLPIGQMEGQWVTVWNGSEWSEVQVVKTGIDQEMIRVYVENMETGQADYLTCTPYHKWYLKDYTELRTFQLERGNELLVWKDSEGVVTRHKVMGLLPVESQDSYCFNEPLRNMGVFNGILTGQCQEIALPTKPFSSVENLFKKHSDGTIALCFLGSIVLKDYTDEEYEELCYTLCKIIDNTIGDTKYPYASMEETAKGYRSIGVGMTNLAHYMASKGLAFDSEAGRNEIHKLAERHSYFLHKASVRLAKEKGVFKYIDRSKYKDGWIPLDTYKKEVDQFITVDNQYPWEELRQDILKHGVRFSVLEAQMPVESSSLVTNSTNAIYPVRNLELYKNSRKGSVYYRAPDMDTLHYQSAWDIPSQEMIKVYAIVQKWMGQSISADFWHDYNKGDLKQADIIRDVLLSAKLGMKTWYYHNFKMKDNKRKEETVTQIEESGCESCSL